jgi:hypothetical protein
VFIGLIFSPSFSSLNNNYTVYQYQSAVAKRGGQSSGGEAHSNSNGDNGKGGFSDSTGKAHKSSDLGFPFSSSSSSSFDNANPITDICPDGSLPTDKGQCKTIQQQSDSENPITTITTSNTKDDNKNNKDNNNKNDFTVINGDSGSSSSTSTGKAHKSSDLGFPFSSSSSSSFDNANPITTDSHRKDNSNNNNNNNKDTTAATGTTTIEQSIDCKKGKHFDAILAKCVKDISPSPPSPAKDQQQQQQEQTAVGDTQYTSKHDSTAVNPIAEPTKVSNKKSSPVIDSCKLDLHLDVKKGSCVGDDKTSPSSSSQTSTSSQLTHQKQTDNTGSGNQGGTDNGITTTAVGGNDNNNNNKDDGNNSKDTTTTAVATATAATTSTNCPDGSKPSDTGKCKSTVEQCPKSFFFLNHDTNCVPDEKCPKGFETHNQDETGTCYPVIVKVDCKKNPNDHSCPRRPPTPPQPSSTQPISLSCPKGSKLVNGKCQVTVVQQEQQTKNVVVIRTQVDTVARNFIINNIGSSSSSSSSSSSQQGKQQHTTFLLLLDTAQLCQIAGDTQCVTKQNQFKTLNLVTKLDSTGKTWAITGQAENIASAKTQRNVQLTTYFYDSKGNNVGGQQKVVVNPEILKSLQSGGFSIKASTSAMKGTPSFLRLEYQATAS